eukprot:scaffold25564_cov74-Phaeocystis_antarctica.AAC.4
MPGPVGASPVDHLPQVVGCPLFATIHRREYCGRRPELGLSRCSANLLRPVAVASRSSAADCCGL